MPKFNKNEFLVFETILKEQTMDNKTLLEKLSMDPSNLSKYKRRLLERTLIFEGLSQLLCFKFSHLWSGIYCCFGFQTRFL